MGGSRVVAKLADRLISIHDWHHQVNQQQSRRMFLGHAHKLIAIMRDQDIEPRTT
jgi:hypothetical protein